MEAEVTAIASGSTSNLAYRMRRAACGIHGRWTPKSWNCEVCRDHFLCDDWYRGSLDKSEALSAPPQGHCGDHPLSADVETSFCHGCGSYPIRNVRWHCKVCLDFDLCEACYGGLDAWDVLQEHSKEHPMIAVRVICTDEMLKLQPNFDKPVDPQWSYRVDGGSSHYDFLWVKREPVFGVSSGVNDAIFQALGNANEDKSIPTSKLKGHINVKCGNLFSQQASQGTETYGMLEWNHKVFLSHAGPEKDFVEQLHRDLSRVHHFGIFFDKDDQSLPKGEPFPEKIFDAAMNCELAIVVISPDYFIRKWPMLELATFVEAQKTRPELKILPVFYRLSVEEFKKRQQLFWTSWKEMGLESEDKMEKWKEALKVISRSNGLEYNKRMGEVAFRDSIVETVYKRVNPELMWDASHVQGMIQMQETIQESLTLLKTHIPKQRVCLIIDNVSDNQASIEEARTLLNLPFKEGSLILVTSRSSFALEILKIEKRFTMRVPTLTTQEAKALFSHHAGCDTSSLTKEQMKAMENFVERCNFKVEGMASQEYHPLALKVFGTRVGPNVEEWQNIRIDSKYYENENTHSIFSILRSSFDALNLRYQRIFLDIALASSNPNINLRIEDLGRKMLFLYDETDAAISLQLVEVLHAKSLVEFYDVADNTIYVHELYHEFARMEVARKELHHSPRCCFSRGSMRQYADQEKRVRIQRHPVSHVTKDMLACRVCLEVELMSIQDCANLVSVDVPEMENLRMFHVFGGCPQLKSVNLEGAVNLRHLAWRDFEGEYPDLTSLESLEELRIDNDEAKSPSTLHGCLDFSKSSNLESLSLSYLPRNLLNLNQAVRLKILVLVNCQHLERFEGLEALVQLKRIKLQACSSLVEFPSLASFPSLKDFFLEGAGKLKAIHGFANLTALRELSLRDGRELEELPGIEACTRLSELNLSGTSIGDCSWIHMMKDLTVIDLSGTKIRSVPCCSSLCKLSRLWLQGCQALESIGDNTGPTPATFPQSLRIFSAWKSRSLNVVPQFHHKSALNHLDINETSVQDISGVTCCKQLQMLSLGGTRITSLPDLSSLTRLEALDVHGCELLTIMDNITSLPALEDLYVYGCTSLSALPDLRSSLGLTELALFDCPLVDPNAVKLPSGSPVDMDMDEDAVDHDQSDDDDDVQECEGEASAVTDVQKSEPTHNPWRSATLLSLLAMGGLLVRWLGRKQGKGRSSISQHEMERQ